MNRTFKVVFNHARGCMVAVNEITRSLKKNSKKTVVATAVAAALLGLGVQAQATEYNSTQTVSSGTAEYSGDTFQNITVSTEGGAIVLSGSSSTLTIKNSKFLSNYAKSGGAIYSVKGSTLIIEGTEGSEVEFKGNHSTDGRGGAINTYGTVTINYAIFENNVSTSFGGAIEPEAGSNVTVENSTFTSNSATHGGVSDIYGTLTVKGTNLFTLNSASYGGALFVNSQDGSTLIVGERGSSTYSTFRQNNSYVKGGAIHASQSLTIYSGHFVENTSNGKGGAINLSSSQAIISGSESNKIEFTGNKSYGTSDGDGGGAISIESSSGSTAVSYASFTGNTSALKGGAIYLSAATPTSLLTLSNSEFTSNKAGTEASDYSDGFGGAIYLTDAGSAESSSAESSSAESLTNVTFSTNQAGQGGAIYVGTNRSLTIGSNTEFTGNTATTQGGAIWNAGTTTLSNVTFTGNKVTAGDSTALGGAIYSSGTLSLTNATFGGTGTDDANTAYSGGAIYTTADSTLEIGSGSTFTGNTATTQGGAIWNAGTTTLSNVTFTGNKATAGDSTALGGAIYSSGTLSLTNVAFSGTGTEDASAYFGGAIYVDTGSTLEIGDSSSFKGNVATESGGAIYSLGTLTVGETEFSNNKSSPTSFYSTSKMGGGAIYSMGTGTFTGTTFTGNEAWSGGAIYSKANLSISEATFGGEDSVESNKATYMGGAICIYTPNDATSNVTLSITDTSFINNTAEFGGAISADKESNLYTLKVKLNNTTFTNNSASRNGGALYLSGGGITLLGANKFTGNSSEGSGGAIYHSWPSTLTIGSSEASVDDVTVFKNNKAKEHGGAICSINGLNLTNVIFGGTEEGEKNTAKEGGAIYCLGSGFVLSDTKFINNEAEIGGAINYDVNYSVVRFSMEKINEFKGNKATAGSGGAIYANVRMKGDSNVYWFNIGNEDEADWKTTFTENTATEYGGAIYFVGRQSLSSPTIYNASFIENSARSGGAIYYGADSKTVVFSYVLGGNNFFTDNKATDSGGAICQAGTYSTLVIGSETDDTQVTTFKGNNVTIEADKDGFGGAIYTTGGYNINNAVFEENYVLTERRGNGGAICSYSGNGTEFKISNSKFTKNKAFSGGAIYFNLKQTDEIFVTGEFTENETLENGYGGAIYNYGKSKLTIGDAEASEITTTFTGNTADYMGGAIYAPFGGDISISNTSFTTNTSKRSSGGALFIDGIEGAKLNLHNVTFGGTGEGEGNNAQDAGAIYLKSQSSSYAPLEFKLTGTVSFINNTANSGNGGAIQLGQNVNLDATEVTSLTFISNSATSNLNTYGNGGAIHSINSAIAFKGVTFDSNTASYAGGAIYVEMSSHKESFLTLSGVNEFTNNEAKYGGAITTSSLRYNDYGTATLTIGSATDPSEVTTFKNNRSTGGLGGAIYATDVKSLSIHNAVFGGKDEGEGNYSRGYGGAIYLFGESGGQFEILNSKFIGNSAGSGGGALYFRVDNDKDGEITVSGEFKENSSGWQGGAIFLEPGCTLNIEKTTTTGITTTFENNEASEKGGALYLCENTTTNVRVDDDTTFSGNKAKLGGFAYLDGSAKLNLNIAEGKTLTIGTSNVGETDSIASSDTTSTLSLLGAGTVDLKGLAKNFSGDVNVGTDGNKTTAQVSDAFAKKIRNVTLGDEASLTLGAEQELSSDRTADTDQTTFTLGKKANLTLPSLTLLDGTVSKSGSGYVSARATIALDDGAQVLISDTLSVGECGSLSITVGDATTEEANVSVGTVEVKESANVVIGSENAQRVRFEAHTVDFTVASHASVLVKNGATFATYSSQIPTMAIGTSESAMQFEEDAWLEFIDEGKVAETDFESWVNDAGAQNIRFELGTLTASEGDKDLTADANLWIGEMTGFDKATIYANRTLSIGKTDSRSDVRVIDSSATGAKLEILTGRLATLSSSLFTTSLPDANKNFTTGDLRSNVTLKDVATTSIDLVDEGTCTHAIYDQLVNILSSKTADTNPTLKNLSLSHATLKANDAQDTFTVNNGQELYFGVTDGFAKVKVSKNSELHLTGELGGTNLVEFYIGNVEFEETSDEEDAAGETAKLYLEKGRLTTNRTTVLTEDSFTSGTKKKNIFLDADKLQLVLTDEDENGLTHTVYDDLRKRLTGAEDEDGALKSLGLSGTTLHGNDATDTFDINGNLVFGAMDSFATVTVKEGNTLELGNSKLKLASVIEDIVLESGAKLKLIGGALTTKVGSLFTGGTADNPFEGLTAKNVEASDADQLVILTDEGTATFTTYDTIRKTLKPTGADYLKGVSLSNATVKADTEASKTFSTETTLTFGALSGFTTVTVNAGDTLTLGNGSSSLSSSIETIKLADGSGDKEAAQLVVDGGKLTTYGSSLFTEALTDTNKNYQWTTSSAKKENVTLKNTASMSIDLLEEGTCDVNVYYAMRDALIDADSTKVKNLSLRNATLKGNTTSTTFTLEKDQTLTFDAMTDFTTVTLGEKSRLYLLGLKNTDVPSSLDSFVFGTDSELHLENGTYVTDASFFLDGQPFDSPKRENIFLGSNVDLTFTNPGTIKHKRYNELKSELTGNAEDGTKNEPLTKLSLNSAELIADDEATGGRDIAIEENITFGAMTGFTSATIAKGKTLTLAGAKDDSGRTVESSIKTINYGTDSKLHLLGQTDKNQKAASLSTAAANIFDGDVTKKETYWDATTSTSKTRTVFNAENVTKKDSVVIADSTVAIDIAEVGTCSFSVYEALKGKLTTEDGSTFTDLSLSKALLKGEKDANGNFTSELEVGSGRSLSFGALHDFKSVTVQTGGELNLEGLEDNASEFGTDTVTLKNVSTLNLKGGRIRVARATLLDGADFSATNTLKEGVHITNENVIIDFIDEDETVSVASYNNVRKALAAEIEPKGEKTLKSVSLLKSTLDGAKDSGDKTFTTDADVTFGAMTNFDTVTVSDGNTLHLGNKSHALDSQVNKFELGTDSKLMLDGGSLTTSAKALFNQDATDSAVYTKKTGVTVTNPDFVLNLTDSGEWGFTTYEKLRTELSTDTVRFLNLNMENATITDTTGKALLTLDNDLSFGALSGFDCVFITNGSGSTLNLGMNNGKTLEGETNPLSFTTKVDYIVLNDGQLNLGGGTIYTKSYSLVSHFGDHIEVQNVTVKDSDLVVNFTDSQWFTLDMYNQIREGLATAEDKKNGKHLVNVNLLAGSIEADNENFTVDGNLTFGGLRGFNEVTVAKGQTLTIGGDSEYAEDKNGIYSNIAEIKFESDAKLNVNGGFLRTARKSLLDSNVKKSNVTIYSGSSLDFNDGIETTYTEYKNLQSALKYGDTSKDLKELSLSRSTLKGTGSNTFTVGKGLDLSFGSMEGFSKIAFEETNGYANSNLTITGLLKDSEGKTDKATVNLENVTFQFSSSEPKTTCVSIQNGYVTAKASLLLESEGFTGERRNNTSVWDDVDLTLSDKGTITHTDYNKLKAKISGADYSDSIKPFEKLSLKNAVLVADEADTGGKDFTASENLTFGAMTGFDKVTVADSKKLTINGATDTDNKIVQSTITNIELGAGSSLAVNKNASLATMSGSLLKASVSDGTTFAANAQIKDNVSIDSTAAIDFLDAGTCAYSVYTELTKQLGNAANPFKNLSLSNALLEGTSSNTLTVANGQNLSFGAVKGFGTVSVENGGELTLGRIANLDSEFADSDSGLSLANDAVFNLGGGTLHTKFATIGTGTLGASGADVKSGVNILSQRVAIDITDEGKTLTTEQYKNLRHSLGVKTKEGTETKVDALNQVSLSKSTLTGTDASGTKENFATTGNSAFGALTNFGTVTIGTASEDHELHIGYKDLESTIEQFVFNGNSSLSLDGGKLRTASTALFNSDFTTKGKVTVTNADFVLNLTDTATKNLSEYEKIRSTLASEGTDHLKTVNLEYAVLRADGDAKLNADANLTFKTVQGFDTITIGAGNILTLKEGTSDIEKVVFTDDASKLVLVDGGVTTKLTTFFKAGTSDDVQFDSTLTKRNIEITEKDSFVVNLKDTGTCDIANYETIRSQLGGTEDTKLKQVNLIEATLVANDTTKTFTTDATELTFGAMKDFTNVTVSAANTLHIGKNGSTLESTIDDVTLENGDTSKLSLDGGILNTNAKALLENPNSGSSLFNGAAKKAGVSVTDTALTVNFKDEGTAALSDYEAVRSALNVENSTEGDHLKKVNLENATLKADGDKTFTTDADLTYGAISGFTTFTVAEETTLKLGNKTLETGLASDVKELVVNGSLKIEGKVTTGNKLTVDAETLSGSGAVAVGSSEENGAGADVHVGTLAMKGGYIFVDPLIQNEHSTLSIDALSDNTLNTNVTTGNNALVAIGGTVAEGESALAALQEKDSSFDPSAVVYLAKAISMGDVGSLIIDPTITAVEADTSGKVTATKSSGTATYAAKTVTIAKNGALILNQTALSSSTVITGASSVTFESGATLGVANAEEGTIAFTGSSNVTGLTSIVTDNPYYEGYYDGNGNIIIGKEVEMGNLAVASTGVQALTRRADYVLTSTIEKRSYEERDEGVSLWVDVGGEGYKANRLGSGQSFKSDMGYGVFGLDYAFGNGGLAGFAFQYGKGTVRSSLFSIKNKVKNYAGTGYVGYGFGKAKVLLEAAYIDQDNSITSSREAFNQKAGSQMYSVGVTGRLGLKAGNFDVTPSVGVRVSKLKTDAMHSGNVEIGKQSQTLVQMPIALRVKTKTQTADGWTVEPNMRVAFVPSFGDTSIRILEANQRVLDSRLLQGDLGLTLRKGNFQMDATFSYGGGSQGMSSAGGKIGVKYLF